MMMKGKRCLVLGGTSGLGESVVRSLVAQEACVTFTYFKSNERASLLCEWGGAALSCYQMDITEDGGIQSLAKLIEGDFPDLEIVINCLGKDQTHAGSSTRFLAANRTMDLCLYSAITVAEVFGKMMMKNQGGAIVNVASTAGIRPLPRNFDYVAAKAGIIAVTKSLALAFAPKVLVNAVAPGWFSSERGPREMERYGREIELIPLGRIGRVDDVAKVILFLADKSLYVTGQTIVVDGGFCL